MAKKFGKFLLFTAAVGTVAAAAYYYMQKKDQDNDLSGGEDSDYDDFSEDLDEDADSSRNYVPLSRENTASSDTLENDQAVPAPESDDFTPLASKLAQDADEKTEEVVEEFFDEEDASEEEPPLPEEN